MKKNLVLVLFGMLLLACTPQKSNESVYDIKLSSNALNFKSEEITAKTVVVTTEDKKWKATLANPQDESWLEVGANLYANTLAVKPKNKNTNVDARQAVVNVATESGSRTVELVVSQLGIGPEILVDIPSVDVPLDGIAEIKIEVTTNIEYDIVMPSWVTKIEPKSRALENFIHYFSVGKNETGKIRNGEIIFKSKDVALEKQRSVQILQKGGADIDVPKDKKHVPVAARAANGEFQPGGEIALSYDNDMSTCYHSRWSGATVMPVKLEYDMPTSAQKIDYLIYYTRPGGGNGNFGKVELWANTYTDATFNKLGDWDFRESAGAHVMILPQAVATPKTFRIVVKNGSGGFASCAEMEFYTYGESNQTQKEAIEKVFTSEACMKLKDGVTDEQIAKLPSQLQEIAFKLRSNTYPSEFRCQSYKAYSSPAMWSERNVTRPYSNLDNPTGIEVKAGEKFYVYVGPTWGNNISLLCVDNLINSGQTFILRSGINEFTTTQNSQVYVQYFVEDLQSANSKPIEIHFPEKNGGVVWGYFNLEKHKTVAELERIMKINSSPLSGGQFVIQGKYVQWNYLRSTLSTSASAVLESLGIWDEMIAGHWDLMGIGEQAGQFPTQRNNRQLAVSNVDSKAYMHATDYYVFFESKNISARTSKVSMFADRDKMWGPAHEFGHQSDRALSWHGYSEASNNLFSNLATWQFAQKYNTGCKTRGPGMQLLNHYAYEHGLNFMDFPFNEIPAGSEYDADGLFLELRLSWQLYVYYSILGKDPTFYPKFFKLLRENYSPNLAPQERSMQFYQLACQATATDLTEFFEAWGWFNLIDKEIDQYGKVRHLLTAQMVATAKNAVAAHHYAPAMPLQYIDDRNEVDAEDRGWAGTLGQVGYWQTFRDNPAISSAICYIRNGDAISIENGANAVGFEIRQGSATGKLLGFSVRYSFVSTLLTGSNKLYAVRADGTRVEIAKK